MDGKREGACSPSALGPGFWWKLGGKAWCLHSYGLQAGLRQKERGLSPHAFISHQAWFSLGFLFLQLQGWMAGSQGRDAVAG